MISHFHLNQDRLYLGKWQPSDERPVGFVTLTDPSLEFSTASVRIAGDPEKKYFHRGRGIQFVRAQQEATVDDLPKQPSDLRWATTLCGGLMELGFSTTIRRKAAELIEQRLRAEMPSSIGQDDAADWDRWPSSGAPWRGADAD